MLAKLKDWVTKKQLGKIECIKFDWYLKVLHNNIKKDWTTKLSNWIWYESKLLEFKKESWWSRKPKQEIIKIEEEIKIDIWRVNMELKVWEYEEIIKMKEKECDSWMKDFYEAEKEKLFYERKYLKNRNELQEEELKNISLSERISLSIELQKQLRNKKDMWKKLFLINIFIDVTYLVIKYLWI